MGKFKKRVCEFARKPMKFKTEIFLLLLAIALYLVSAFFYFYEMPSQSTSYPYRDYAIPLTIVASALLVVGAILYSKRR